MSDKVIENDNPLFGRRWKITLYTHNGTTIDLSNSDNDSPVSNSLECTFNIDYPGYQACYYGDITVYNLNGATESYIIDEGDRVTVEAGYINGYYGKIFDGKVFQIFRERENVVDYKLNLHCLDGMGIFDNNIVNYTFQAGSNQRGHIQSIANQAKTPFQIGIVSDNINTQPLARGKTFFGSPEGYLRAIAKDNNAQVFIQDNVLHVPKLSDGVVLPQSEAIKVTPETGLIGVPQVTTNGVQFKTLLNPMIKIVNPSMLVYLDPLSTTIRQQLVRIGQYFTVLDKDGYYQVGSLRHYGDTRANDWYTEVVGINSNGVLPILVQTAQQTPNS